MSNTPRDLHNELVYLAYAAATEPERLQELLDVINARFTEVHDLTADEISQLHEFRDARSKALEFHLANAFRLLEENAPASAPTSAAAMVEQDPQPALLLTADLVVTHANTAAQNVLGLAAGQPLTDALVASPGLAKLREALGPLSSARHAAVPAAPLMVQLHTASNDKTMHMLLQRTRVPNADVAGQLSSIDVTWDAQLGEPFGKAFGLTAVELEIVRAFVSGISTAQLAAERERSIQTIRTQQKNLFRKLNITSQRELVCLYYGFAGLQLAGEPGDAVAEHGRAARPPAMSLTLTDGRRLCYALFGATHGRPVVYFHGLVADGDVPPGMQTLLEVLDITLIAIWRPGFIGSDAVSLAPVELPAHFADDVKAVLDALQIGACQLLGMTTGAIYAYAFAQKYPQSVQSIVTISSAIPLLSHKQLDAVKARHRIVVYLARYFPAALPFLLKATLLKDRHGHVAKSFLDSFSNASGDQEVASQPGMARFFSRSLESLHADALEAFVCELRLSACDWRRYIPSGDTRITFLHGDEDPYFPHREVAAFAASLSNARFCLLPHIGQLLFYRYPEQVFAALRR